MEINPFFAGSKAARLLIAMLFAAGFSLPRRRSRSARHDQCRHGLQFEHR